MQGSSFNHWTAVPILAGVRNAKQDSARAAPHDFHHKHLGPPVAHHHQQNKNSNERTNR